MEHPEYLKQYNFNWHSLDILAAGASSIDVKQYLKLIKTKEEAESFLLAYGYDLSDPVQAAEIFGNYQEALQFIKKYFLKEGNQEDGLDLTVPMIFYTITDVRDLFLIATRSSKEYSEVDAVWAGIVLKVMNTILHLDKDLRHQYFKTIQTQIFDRFYKYIYREDEALFLVDEQSKVKIPLCEFETKSKKARESIIIKLLHKRENVAEELFDRIGVRFITKSRFDCIRVLHFLHQNDIVMVNNIKPSRTQNTMVNLEKLQVEYKQLIKDSIANKLSEDAFLDKANALMLSCYDQPSDNRNKHTSKDYKAIHFTARQLIKYKNPFYQSFKNLREEIKDLDCPEEIRQKIMDVDTRSVASELKFFYPFEVQITDEESHQKNTEGEASHQEYKRSQVQSALTRLFKPLLELEK